MADHSQSLREDDVDSNPIRQFAAWFEAAREAGVREPEAMAVASATRDGFPSVRMVLLKRFDEHGFVFFTNYGSRKGRELTTNPQAALLFHWDVLGRQVRIEGPVQRLSPEESAQYVRSRARGSQLSALASPQSQVVESRQWLEERVRELAARHQGADPPLPENWGGLRVAGERFEFWQHRSDRLHDRLRYCPDGRGWRVERLAP